MLVFFLLFYKALLSLSRVFIYLLVSDTSPQEGVRVFFNFNTANSSVLFGKYTNILSRLVGV